MAYVQLLVLYLLTSLASLLLQALLPALLPQALLPPLALAFWLHRKRASLPLAFLAALGWAFAEAVLSLPALYLAAGGPELPPSLLLLALQPSLHLVASLVLLHALALLLRPDTLSSRRPTLLALLTAAALFPALLAALGLWAAPLALGLGLAGLKLLR